MITTDGLDPAELIFLCALVIIVFLVTIIYMLVQTIKRHFRKKRGENMRKKELIKALAEKQKAGWVIAHGMYIDRFWCSCGYIHIMDTNTIEWKYCPVCGATKAEEKR